MVLAAMLSQLRLGYEFQFGAGDPTGPGWHPLADIEPRIDDWLAELLAGVARGRTDVAGAFLASYLSGALAEPVAAAVFRQRRAWPVEAVILHRNPGGWFDGLAIPPSTPIWVLPDDPWRDQPGAIAVPDLQKRVAAGLVAALEPYFSAIRSRTRLGGPFLWGQTGDLIARGNTDSWPDVVALTEAIAELVPHLRVNRSPDVRGTCCLFYKVFDAYCTRCPLVPRGTG